MGKKVIIFAGLTLLALMMVCSCQTTRYVPTHKYHSDTIRISTHDTIIVKQHAENVSVPLPTVYLSNATRDTTSTLADGLYKSVASIRNGLLYHSLYTLPDAKVNATVEPTDTTKIQHDTHSIARLDSIKVPYPVVQSKVVYELHWWQKIPYYIGWLAIIIGGIYVIKWLAKKNILHS